MSCALEARSISKYYRRGTELVRAVVDVDLSLQPGSMTALVGRSGSGKSTLLQILGCLDTPDTGMLTINGREVTGAAPATLAGIRGAEIGFVFQHFSLLPRVSALDNVALPLVYAGLAKAERRAIAVAALERLGLGERLQHTAAELSGGQQQRVAIARALVRDPAIILADEPTGALDETSARDLLAILRRLCDEGATMLIVTHDAQVASYADRVLEMRDGHLGERGP
ncbi:ABC transporter ATP-binding protein [Brevundimonas aurantiaca]|uniref:ABC transporter ATP-binding protein n=1 Tax=Brevundimonas aurantiaca TaxID=74316 RepID=UPI0017491426|nr:ABC transporter ATP-binding protein [Brevundimonas aurantiaca]